MTKSQRRRLGICPVCFRTKPLEKHHQNPRRFYGKNRHVIHLCSDCHKEIEVILNQAELFNGGRLPHDEYYRITVDFVRNTIGGQHGRLAQTKSFNG